MQTFSLSTLGHQSYFVFYVGLWFYFSDYLFVSNNLWVTAMTIEFYQRYINVRWCICVGGGGGGATTLTKNVNLYGVRDW
jgi:hypothetical protein